MRRSRRAEDDGREEEDDLPAGVHRTPAPWTLQAESWIFPHWTSTRRIADVRRESKVLLAQRQEEEDAAAGAASSSRDEQLAKAGLSPGSFHPLEKLHPLALALASSGAAEEAHSNEQQTQTEANNAKIRAAADEFRGGPGGWILYRYTHSPVGPYDELIYVAGLFKSPSAGNTALRITNIYVSSTASVYNGRKNWNIPKHRALFEWSQPAARTSSAAVQTVRVYLPVGGTQQQQQQQSKGKEIFAARLFPHLSSSCCNWLPSLPIPAFTAHIPSWLNLKLCAPPLLDCTTTTDSVGGGSGSGGSKSSSSSSSSKGEMQRDDEAQEEGLASSEPENVWRSVSPTFAGWARPARAEAILLVSWGGGGAARPLQPSAMFSRTPTFPASQDMVGAGGE
ncbi:hypothetical protein IE81DRAFT_326860 [Ceraceosorus guamensis]|uniref:Uncharacterized protein n=1 Tax=Ceraceosorus guamensis TaxID=1522189 RepID=A0A316VPV3_9BASI|nr:hypothetical protein IE81DRAFT_326860 [Ceraceosorus guamensis]PWN39108.1 hypothetical protein IE81DRAFT_326860 [Ceraceosorus guamensis]